eukprot:1431271-Pyramimonas_sp.AAC.1
MPHKETPALAAIENAMFARLGRSIDRRDRPRALSKQHGTQTEASESVWRAPRHHPTAREQRRAVASASATTLQR